MEMSDPMKFPKRPHQHHHHQQHYSSKLTNQQSNKLKGTQSAQNPAPLIYDSTDPTSAGGAAKDASNSIFDLENNATLDEGQSALLSIEATTISTSQMNIAMHSRGGQAAALIDDDDEDYAVLPNDVVEFNCMDDLVDFFNSSTNQEHRNEAASDGAQKLNLAASHTLQQHQYSNLVWPNLQQSSANNRGQDIQNNISANNNAQSSNQVVENFIIEEKYKMPNLIGPNKTDDDFIKYFKCPY